MASAVPPSPPTTLHCFLLPQSLMDGVAQDSVLDPLPFFFSSFMVALVPVLKYSLLIHLHFGIIPEAQIYISNCLLGFSTWIFIGLSNLTCPNLAPCHTCPTHSLPLSRVTTDQTFRCTGQNLGIILHSPLPSFTSNPSAKPVSFTFKCFHLNTSAATPLVEGKESSQRREEHVQKP